MGKCESPPRPLRVRPSRREGVDNGVALRSLNPNQMILSPFGGESSRRLGEGVVRLVRSRRLVCYGHGESPPRPLRVRPSQREGVDNGVALRSLNPNQMILSPFGGESSRRLGEGVVRLVRSRRLVLATGCSLACYRLCLACYGAVKLVSDGPDRPPSSYLHPARYG